LRRTCTRSRMRTAGPDRKPAARGRRAEGVQACCAASPQGGSLDHDPIGLRARCVRAWTA
jgi:hypothetical protein